MRKTLICECGGSVDTPCGVCRKREQGRRANKKYYQNNKEFFKQINKQRYDLKYYNTRNKQLSDNGRCITHPDRPSVVSGRCSYCQLIHNYRRRVIRGLREQNVIKSQQTIELLGCTWAYHRTYLENLFQPGMTWDNYGHKGWHVDHIRPVSSFDLRDPEQMKLCWHYTNTQPLWAKDNLAKSDIWR